MKLLSIFFISLFLVGCAQEAYVAPVVETTEEIPAVNTTPDAMACPNECIKDYCIDTDVYECKYQETGCNYVQKKGPVLGMCGIECYKNTDCNWNQDCSEENNNFKIAYTCVNVSDEAAASRKKLVDAGIDFR